MSPVLDRTPVATSDPSPYPDIRVRRMTRADETALDVTFAGLSERSRFLRYHSATPRLTARMRRALLDIDGARHLAHVAEVAEPGGHRAIAIGREAARLGYAELHADVLPENRPMRRLLGQVFPDAVVENGDGTLRIRDWVGATVR